MNETHKQHSSPKMCKHFTLTETHTILCLSSVVYIIYSRVLDFFPRGAHNVVFENRSSFLVILYECIPSM